MSLQHFQDHQGVANVNISKPNRELLMSLKHFQTQLGVLNITQTFQVQLGVIYVTPKLPNPTGCCLVLVSFQHKLWHKTKGYKYLGNVLFDVIPQSAYRPQNSPSPFDFEMN